MPDQWPIHHIQAHYRKVLTQFRKKKVVQDWTYETKTRVYKVLLERDIPKHITIRGCTTRVIYKGQSPNTSALNNAPKPPQPQINTPQPTTEPDGQVPSYISRRGC